MSSRKKLITITISLIILNTNLAFADSKYDTTAIDISGGESHTLVLTANNWVWACGPNGGHNDVVGTYYGVLGTGSGNYSIFERTLVRVHGPNNIGYLEDINDVAAGWTHSLALDVNGFVWAWGNNRKGQLGDNQKSGYQSTTPVQVLSGEQNPNDPNSFLQYIIDISAGRSGHHSLTVDANNFVYAWGYNNKGQLGDGNYPNDKLTPVKVHGANDVNYLENIVAVSAGEENSMAMDANGYVWTWGDNDYGKLGINVSGGIRDTPVQVHGVNNVGVLQNIVAISAGCDHCVALEKYYPIEPNYQGMVYTWGRNIQGQCGNGESGSGKKELTPVIVLSGQQDPNNPNSYLKDIIAVSAGEGHSMALDINGFVYTWGENSDGQLGNGTNDPCTTPVKVVGPDLNNNGNHEPNEGYLENIVAISAAYWHCIAIDTDGTIWTWGRGSSGRLGLGDSSNRNIPNRIPIVYNTTQGTSYFRIQDAISDSNDNDIIEAVTCTYYENIDFLDKSITLRSNNPYNWNVVDKTIIEGPNSYYPVKFYYNSGSKLTGITVKNINSNGKGIYCYNSSSVDITNCQIQNCSQFGINLYSSSPNIINCKIENNKGYGIYCTGASPAIISCAITKNGDGGSYDSAIYCTSHSSPMITNCIFIGNESYYGAGMYNYSNSNGHPTMTNCTFRGNIATSGGVINTGSNPLTVTNCILWNEDYSEISGAGATITYSDIQGQGIYPGTGNINADPCFYDANNYHLTANSPCIDEGNNLEVPPDETDLDGDSNTTEPIPWDIDGQGRKIDGDSNGTLIVDMGADEYYWDPPDFNPDGIVNFLDYAVFAAAWLTENADISLDDDNDVDYYDLDEFCENWLLMTEWYHPLEYMMMGSGAGEGLGLMGDEQQPEQIAQTCSELAEPIDIEALLKWLEDIWLDPDVQETIDEETWLKFVEAVKSEFE
jgi:parallel beta-helix repeat protein